MFVCFSEKSTQSEQSHLHTSEHGSGDSISFSSLESTTNSPFESPKGLKHHILIEISINYFFSVGHTVTNFNVM